MQNSRGESLGFLMVSFLELIKILELCLAGIAGRIMLGRTEYLGRSKTQKIPSPVGLGR